MKVKTPKKEYEELLLKEFVKKYPGLAKMLPENIDMSDTNYIVKLDMRNGRAEIGYKEDKWLIK